MADREGSLAAPDPRVADDLDEALDDLLVGTVRSAVPWLDGEMVRLLRRPGRRLRPRLVLRAARCGAEPDLAAALCCATAVELLHRGSLVHDDLMDDAPFRGEDATLHQRMGTSGAVLGGDYLIAVAGRLVAGVGSPAAVVWQEAYVDMCLGQARESANRHRLVSPSEYLSTIRGKTAAPLRAAAHLGGLCAGLPAAAVRALAEYGECLGVLLQLVDDVLDVASTAALCGKPVRHDVAQGTYTLPVLFAAGAWEGRIPRQPGPVGGPVGPVVGGPAGTAITGGPGGGPAEVGHTGGGLGLGPELPADRLATVYDEIRERGLRPAVAVAADWAGRAVAALAGVPDSPAHRWLAALPHHYLREQLTTRVAPAYRHLVEFD